MPQNGTSICPANGLHDSNRRILMAAIFLDSGYNVASWPLYKLSKLEFFIIVVKIIASLLSNRIYSFI